MRTPIDNSLITTTQTIRFRANLFIWLELSFIAGILIGTLTTIPALYLWTSILVSLISCSVFYNRYLLRILLCLTIFSLGFWYINQANIAYNQQITQYKSLKKVDLVGQIDSYPSSQQLSIKVTEVSSSEYASLITGRILVNLESNTFFNTINYGDQVSVQGSVKKLEGYYADVLKNKGYSLAVQFAKVKKVESFQTCNLICRIYSPIFNLKRFMLDRIDILLPGQEGDFVKGLLIGYKDTLPKQIQDDFKKVGISHVLAVSGYNVSIIVALVFGLLKKLYLPRLHILLTTIIFICCFVIITGGDASIVRASIMSSCILFTEYMGRFSNGVLPLLLCATILIILNPFILVYDLGFQLSFLACLGIMTTSLDKGPAKEKEGFDIDLPIISNMINIFKETLVAHVYVIPLLLFKFGALSVISPIANIIVLPFIPLIMLYGFLIVCGSFLPMIIFLSLPLYLLIQALLSIIHILASIPFGYLEFSPIHNVILLSIYLVGLLIIKLKPLLIKG